MDFALDNWQIKLIRVGRVQADRVATAPVGVPELHLPRQKHVFSVGMIGF